MNTTEIEKLNSKNKNIVMAAGGVSLLGNIAGLLYAINTKKSGWGKVGWFFLGGIIVGIPSGIIGRSMITNNNAKINELGSTVSNAEIAKLQEAAEDKFFEEGGTFR